MLDNFYKYLGGLTSVSAVIISVAIMLLCGFTMTRLTKLLKLPNVTAYILTGIIIGPFCLDLIPEDVIGGMSFMSDVALAFIAFGVGEFFRLPTLRKNGKKVAIITVFESLMASLLVFVLTFFIFRLDLPFSIVLSALAAATAPASTMMTIRQTKARGGFVNTLLAVVALDDVVGLLAFSAAVSVAVASAGGGFSAGDILLPILFNIILMATGCAFGFLLKILMTKRSTDNRLIVSVAFLFAVCGVGAALGVSPLLGCMVMGMTYINASDDDKLFKQLNYFSPPILLLFFVLSGLSFRIDALFTIDSSVGGVPLLVIGILYFFVRIVGKYAGAYVGCLVVKKPASVRNYLGLALIPQAGVSIGLAALAARILGGGIGSMLQTVVLSSGILYELIGPACAKLSLYLSGSYGTTALQETEEESADISESVKDEVTELKERIIEIEAEIAKAEYARSADEAAFNEAAEEFDVSDYMRRYRKFINRR